MSLNINVHPGKLPKFWDRSVVFFVNLKSLFFGNEAKLNHLQEAVHGVKTYGGRLLPIINIVYKSQENLLVLANEPSRSIRKYFSKDLKLQLPHVELLSYEDFYSVDKDRVSNNARLFAEKVSRHPAGSVDGFVTDETLIKWSLKLGKNCLNTTDSSRLCNNKLALYNYLKDKNMPICDTEIAVSNDGVVPCIRLLEKKGYKTAVVKSQIGASGVGMVKVDTSERNINLPGYMFWEGGCMVQGWLEPGINGIREVYSPSVQVFIGEDSVFIYDVTEQILSSQSIHQGNLSPPPYLEPRSDLRDEMLRQSAVVGKWLFSQGYRGMAGVDFIVTFKDGLEEVFVCEVNARVTGATYPSILARYFMSEGAWIMSNLETNKHINGEQLLETMDKFDVLFYPGKDEGFLPINFNLDSGRKVTKGQFLFLGKDLQVCLETLNGLQDKLPMKWYYEQN